MLPIFVETVLQDVWYGMRSLRQHPISTAAAVMTLAIGIGLNAAVFSVVDWVLLRPLPYPAAHELVRVWTAGVGPLTPRADLAYSEFDAFRAAKAFHAAAALSTATRVVAGPGVEPAHIVVARVSGDLSGTFGVYPEMGGTLRPDYVATGAAVVIVSHLFWQTRLASDPSVVGRIVTIDGTPHTIAGVMPQGRGYPADADLWRPITREESEDDDREAAMVARLASGVTPEEASSELATLARGASGGARTAWVEDVQRTAVGGVRRALVALWASAALILLMACANVASLVGARGAARASEIAIRGALGATRARLARQLLIESILLAAIGGVAGLVLGQWTLDAIVALAPGELPRLADIRIDPRIAGAGAVATFAVGLLVGIAPSIAAVRQDLRRALGAATTTVPRQTRRRVLVAAQTAVALVLCVGAGLLARSLGYLVQIDHGFAHEQLLAVQLYLRDRPNADTTRLFTELIAGAESAGGVRAAAVSMRLPTQQTGLPVSVRVRGTAVDRASRAVLRPVTHQYFDTAGIRTISGRMFTAADRRGTARVAVVNSAFVRDVLQQTPPLGVRLIADFADEDVTLVGVAADVTPAGSPDRPAIYVPIEQLSIGGAASLIVRTDRDPRTIAGDVRARLRGVAPTLALDRIEPLSDSLAAGRAAARFNAQLSSAFALLALLLAAIGAYGLTATEVNGRWRELAVRLALGASRGDALWSVLRPGAAAFGVGIALGLSATTAVANGIRSLLHGVTPADPATLLTVPLMLAIVTAISSLLAARRVLRADPAATLRGE